MKIYANHMGTKGFAAKLGPVAHVDFSLFVDFRPTDQTQLSSVNFLALQEPNEYYQHHDWAIKNSNMFDMIFTWSRKIISSCENAMYTPYGTTWLTKEQYLKFHKKQFQVSHVCGTLNKTYGHSMRHEFHIRGSKEIMIPCKLWLTAGDRRDIHSCGRAKELLFGNSQFGVAIENTRHWGYFTEKIIDLFLLKVIPIYWGCKNTSDFFDSRGIIPFQDVDELIEKINSLSDEYYSSQLQIINSNFEAALDYVSFDNTISKSIINRLSEMNLI